MEAGLINLSHLVSFYYCWLLLCMREFHSYRPVWLTLFNLVEATAIYWTYNSLKARLVYSLQGL